MTNSSVQVVIPPLSPGLRATYSVVVAEEVSGEPWPKRQRLGSMSSVANTESSGSKWGGSSTIPTE